MYQSHWGLRETPFRTPGDPRFFYESPTHEEALARLEFLVDQRRRLGLLLGGQGSGKSLIFEVFAQTVRRDGLPMASLNLLGVDPAEFLWQLAVALQLNPPKGLPPYAYWRWVTDRLAEYAYQKRTAVVLLDDVDRAAPEVIVQINRLARLSPAGDLRLTIVLSGRPAEIGRVGDSLLELADLRIDLGCWRPDDTARYVANSLALAGRQKAVFDPSAIARLHQLGGGVPRRISQLADLALLAGAGRHQDHVDSETVESVYRELGAIRV